MKINVNFLLNHASRLRDFVLDLIFPVECLACGQEGTWLCSKCFRKLEFKPAQYCLHCKEENKLGEFCLSCRSQYDLDGVWIAGVYEEPIIAKLIKNLKYCFVRDIAEDLGKFLVLFLRDLINKNQINKIDLAYRADWRKFELAGQFPKILFNFKQNLVMPVPLSNRRERWRGFNQAEAISRVMADYFNLDLSINELVRIKHKKPQVKLSERQRRNNVAGCFSWQGNNLAGRNVIMVDDVVTTGSTLNECAKVLKGNGAGEVWGLVIAKG